jgi:hypothetical protein
LGANAHGLRHLVGGFRAAEARSKIWRENEKSSNRKLPGDFADRIVQSLVIVNHEDGGMLSAASRLRDKSIEVEAARIIVNGFRGHIGGRGFLRRCSAQRRSDENKK